ncbi:nuclear transport factor 2 family protein [Marinibaculum pumilum]|uniref:Nuclear transport factor 2 family protein n=1 Tax=Marinibaculum pumilum TaxID=1766165 RepID=A0ABV7KUI5_9PROT
MIEAVIADWHRFTHGELEGGLDRLLAEDCVFHSPVVHTPQVGREKTRTYLLAACLAFGGEVTDWRTGIGRLGPGFRYVREIAAGNAAVLEFECEIDGVHVNGIDLITCDAEGRIVDFKVMVRPLQGINAIHARMGGILQQMKTAGAV